jgi:hypothetical protein
MTLMAWHKVAMDLVDECGLSHKSYNLHTDNCYTKVSLVETLYNKGVTKMRIIWKNVYIL